MATRDSPYLTTDIPLCSSKKEMSITVSGLVSIQCGNRYQTRGSNGNGLSITTTGNIFVASWVILLVTEPF